MDTVSHYDFLRDFHRYFAEAQTVKNVDVHLDPKTSSPLTERVLIHLNQLEAQARMSGLLQDMPIVTQITRDGKTVLVRFTNVTPQNTTDAPLPPESASNAD